MNKKISLSLTKHEVLLLDCLVKENKSTRTDFTRKCLLEKGRATTPLLQDEELTERLDLLDRIEKDTRERAELRSGNIRLGNENYWNKKTGLDTETRRALQKEKRRKYQREWVKNKRKREG